jgi:formylglycine-generating enzyme
MRRALVVMLWCGCRWNFDALPDSADDAGDAADAGDAGDDAAVVPASCANLPDICGPTGTAPCCATVVVPGGTFFRGYDVAFDGLYPTMAFPATVSSFRLDTYEVTLGRFRAFVEAGGGTQAMPPSAGAGAHPNIAASGWSPTWNALLPTDTAALIASLTCSTYPSWTPTAAANEALPINCISWALAAAFCVWDGGYLPTEAEWHLAASGGDEQRAYPWSVPAGATTIGCGFADYQGCAPGGPSNVGSRSPTGDGRWSNADLAGNVWEWMLDYDGTLPMPCTDCLNTMPNAAHVLRGGSIASTTANLRAADRYAETARGDHIGVRCARPL